MKKWLMLIALPLVLTLAGCSASNMGAIEEQDDGTRATYLKSNNTALYSRLAVRNPIMAVVGDMPRAQATLENRWKFKLDFQYKVKWFDANGFEIGPDSRPWTPVMMPGRTQFNVQATAPNPTATRFEIWVQD
ncbi:MAG: YcfL family protein [Alcanivoracaceae bacterium]